MIVSMESGEEIRAPMHNEDVKSTRQSSLSKFKDNLHKFPQCLSLICIRFVQNEVTLNFSVMSFFVLQWRDYWYKKSQLMLNKLHKGNFTSFVMEILLSWKFEENKLRQEIFFSRVLNEYYIQTNPSFPWLPHMWHELFLLRSIFSSTNQKNIFLSSSARWGVWRSHVHE